MYQPDYHVFTDFSDIIRGIYQKTAMEFEDVTWNKTGYLHFILEHDGCSQQDIADLRVATKATISELIVQLEKDGLIYRERNPEDRRKFSLHLTERGTSIAKQVQQCYRDYCDARMAVFSDEEKQTMISLMIKFVNGVE